MPQALTSETVESQPIEPIYGARYAVWWRGLSGRWKRFPEECRFYKGKWRYCKQSPSGSKYWVEARILNCKTVKWERLPDKPGLQRPQTPKIDPPETVQADTTLTPPPPRIMRMELAELLKKNEKEIHRRLIELSRNPSEARELIDQLVQTQAAMVTVPKDSNRYVGFKRPIDAVKALFEETAHPLSEEEIKDVIVNKGGYRRGDPPSIPFARMTLQKALKAHLPGHDGHKNFALKFLNAKYGLADWPDAMFKRD